MVDTVSQTAKTATAADSRSQVEELSPLIAQVLVGGVVPDCVVVSRGPAPFTGLRVGLVTARALGAAWNVPVLGVDELELQAQAALGTLPVAGGSLGASAESPRWIVSVMDARRHEVYAAMFKATAGVSRLAGDWVGKALDLPAQLTCWDRDFPGTDTAEAIFVGNKAADIVGKNAVVLEVSSLALASGLVVERVMRGAETTGSLDNLNVESLHGKTESELVKLGLGTEPEYLRRPDIQEKK